MGDVSLTPGACVPRLARLRPPAALGQEVRRGHQVLPQRSEVGQGQPADSAGLVPPADPDEGPGGLQGEDLGPGGVGETVGGA